MSYDDLAHPGDPFFSVGDDGEKFAAMNKGVTPIFFMEPVKNEAKSEKEGRPIFEDQERVRIVVAGDPLNQIVHPVDEIRRERFADQYRRWKEQKVDRHITGTPLRHWPPLTPSQIAEFEALHIYNVEGLANIAETNINRAPSLRAWRDRAAAWLVSAAGGAEAMKYADENARLKEDMAEMRKQIADMTLRLDDGERRSPGRPRRDAA